MKTTNPVPVSRFSCQRELLGINPRRVHHGSSFLGGLISLLQAAPARELVLHLQAIQSHPQSLRFAVELARHCPALPERAAAGLLLHEARQLDAALEQHRHLSFGESAEPFGFEGTIFSSGRIHDVTLTPRDVEPLLWEAVETVAERAGPFYLEWRVRRAFLTFEETKLLLDAPVGLRQFGLGLQRNGCFTTELKLTLPRWAMEIPQPLASALGWVRFTKRAAVHDLPSASPRLSHLIDGAALSRALVLSMSDQRTLSRLLPLDLDLEHAQAFKELAESGAGVPIGRLIERGGAGPIPASLPSDVRSTSTLIVGASGQGKTVVMESIFKYDAANGSDIFLVDFTGDTSERCLSLIPPERAEQVVYFDLSSHDQDYLVTLNPLTVTGLGEEDEYRIVEEMVDVFVAIHGPEIFGPRLQDYFRAGVKTLMAYARIAGDAYSSLQLLTPLFTTPALRKQILAATKQQLDPATRSFWEGMFANQNDREAREMLPYFNAKFSAVTQNVLLRRAFCAASSFDISRCVSQPDATRPFIFIANLAKGNVGSPAAVLAGRFILARLMAGIFRRARLDADRRRPLSLFIDEAQNLLADSADEMLAESRKYGLKPTLTCQFLGQMSNRVRRSAITNSGSRILFRLNQEDASLLDAQDLTTLRRHHARLELADYDGRFPRRTSFITDLVSPRLDPNQVADLKRMSVLTHGRSKELVDLEISLLLEGGEPQ